jgi:hypothetical protein
MKTSARQLLTVTMLIALFVINVSCKPTAATHKHEFKKELKAMERSKH